MTLKLANVSCEESTVSPRTGLIFDLRFRQAYAECRLIRAVVWLSVTYGRPLRRSEMIDRLSYFSPHILDDGQTRYWIREYMAVVGVIGCTNLWEL